MVTVQDAAELFTAIARLEAVQNTLIIRGKLSLIEFGELDEVVVYGDKREHIREAYTCPKCGYTKEARVQVSYDDGLALPRTLDIGAILYIFGHFNQVIGTMEKLMQDIPKNEPVWEWFKTARKILEPLAVEAVYITASKP